MTPKRLLTFLLGIDVLCGGVTRIAAAAPLSDAEGSLRRRVVVLFGGDVVLAEHYERTVGDSIAIAFAALDTLRSVDIAMVNLESPVTTRGTRVTKPFNFRTNPRFLPALTGGGIDIVNLANNHIFDYGDVGLFDTIVYLDSCGVLHVGAGRDGAEARAPVIVRCAGVTVAFLGYYGGGESPAATAATPGVAHRDGTTIVDDIHTIRQRADYVVINLHWGTERAPLPDRDQVAFAHALIDGGADAVVGHHPHVLQGVELYRGKPIAYSLGNFIFGGNSRDSYDTALLELTLEEAHVGVRVLPVRVDTWQARMLGGAPGDAVIALVRDRSRMFRRSIFTSEQE